MSKKILVVEDNPFSSSLYKNHLTKAGYSVQIASDGRQALEYADSFYPQLIILDLIIPKIDGFAILKLLKSVKPHHLTPIIVVSDLNQEEDISRCLDFGATNYFSKSDLNYQDLISHITTLLLSPPASLFSK
jgi:DNA-binding response OmpR family regulator